MARAEAGQKIDDLLDEIAELQRMIDTSPAETLEDAAVKLRRLGAYIERGQGCGGGAGHARSGARLRTLQRWPVQGPRAGRSGEFTAAAVLCALT